MRRDRVTSGTQWESTVGYARAVRAGTHIHVSGTTGTDENGHVVAPNDPGRQTEQAIENVARALKSLDAGIDDVVRTRLFVTDIDAWEPIGRVHERYFGDVKPATTMVQVERLISPDLVVEIEATAVTEADDNRAGYPSR